MAWHLGGGARLRAQALLAPRLRLHVRTPLAQVRVDLRRLARLKVVQRPARQGAQEGGRPCARIYMPAEGTSLSLMRRNKVNKQETELTSKSVEILMLIF